jgi:hypothetical protein
MLDLFKSEFMRYRKGALAFYVGQVFVWVLISKISIILAPGVDKYVPVIFSVIIPGFLFGIISMGLHTRKNHWAYLMHRPLSRGRIHLALSAAALCLLFIGFVLPLLSVIMFLDLLTENVVDSRHYLFSLHMLGLTSIAYFAGSFFSLTPSKAAIMGVWVMTFLMMPNQNPASFDLTVDLIFAAVLFMAARGMFKVNVSEFANDKPTFILSALILQPAILLLMLISQVLYFHLPLFALGSHPGKDTTTEYYRGFDTQDSKDAFAQVLSASEHSQKKSLLRQLSLSEYKEIRRGILPIATKGQLFLKDWSFAITDDSRNEIWVFSHDKMLLEGRNIRSGNAVGHLGVEGFKTLEDELTVADQFKAVPSALSGRTIILPDQIFRVDFEERLLFLKHQLPDGEIYMANPRTMFERVVIKSNKALYFVDQIDFEDPDLLAKAEHVVEHPLDPDLDVSMEITEVLEGFLILYASENYHGFEMPGASLTYLQHEGGIESLASIDFPESHLPSLIQYQEFMFSPLVINLLNGTLESVAKFNDMPPLRYRYFWDQRYDFEVVLFALMSAFFSAGLTYWIATKMAMSKSNRLTWTLMNFALCLPGLVAFLLLNNWWEFVFTPANRSVEGGV